jgi:predicted NAD/FAD-binding protein
MSRIAIIGTGIAGLGAAWALSRQHDIQVYEQAAYIGGHSNTVEIDYDGKRIPVDTGFIVYNTVTYPNLIALFEHLGVPTEESDMSFSVQRDGGRLEWAGTDLGTIFAQRRNAFRPRFLRMLAQIVRFGRQAPDDLAAGRLRGVSLADYLDQGGYGAGFRDDYLLPMGACIWSSSNLRMLDFPAETFVRFCVNHHLLDVGQRPPWRTVSGGSREYVRRITAGFRDRIRLRTPVTAVRRDSHGVTVHDALGGAARFDHAVIAAHADQALAMLADASAEERAILGAVHFQPNRAMLHRDPGLMPHARKVWCSWNCFADGDDAGGRVVSLTYWMNRLQNLDAARPVFVSLNPRQEPKPHLTFASFDYEHPLFDSAATAAQQRLDRIQGQRGTWFCGAWCGYGFHEDGLKAGLAVAERLGFARPWAQKLAA